MMILLGFEIWVIGYGLLFTESGLFVVGVYRSLGFGNDQE